MTDDDKALVERLRDFVIAEDIDLAADRIEALSAENERLQFLCELTAVPAGIIEDRGRMEERAAIVAWLRKDDFLMTADAIEAGEHLK